MWIDDGRVVSIGRCVKEWITHVEWTARRKQIREIVQVYTSYVVTGQSYGRAVYEISVNDRIGTVPIEISYRDRGIPTDTRVRYYSEIVRTIEVLNGVSIPWSSVIVRRKNGWSTINVCEVCALRFN